MQMWFLKASDQLWEKGIEFVTGGHAHCEVKFSDGKFFSSTQALGPRFCDHQDLFDTDDSQYDIIDIPCTQQDERTVRALAEMIIHGLTGDKPEYGTKTILLSFLPVPIIRQAPSEWICSESCVYVLQSIGLFMGYVAKGICPHVAYVILKDEISVWQKLRWQETA
jgi:hypothetical protein